MKTGLGKITIEKNGQTKQISEFAWKNMGKNKEGWTVKSDGDAGVNAAPKELQNNEEYTKLIDQAKGYEKDKKYDKALAKYQEAYAIRQVKTVEAKITALAEHVNDPANKPKVPAKGKSAPKSL